MSEEKLMLTKESSIITGFHHFARILENRVAGVEVEFEVQAIRGGIQEKGRMNKIIRPYIEKMRAIEQLIRDMSRRISRMDDRDRLDYALKLKNQYVSLTTATINKLKLEIKNVKDPDRYDILRSLLLNIATLEMFTDEGAEVEGAINISRNRKNEKIEALMNASTTNIIGSELNVIELQNKYIDEYVRRRIKDDVFKVLAYSKGDETVFESKMSELITVYYEDNLEAALSQIERLLEHNKAYEMFVKEIVPSRLMKFYEKLNTAWIDDAYTFIEENGL